MCEKLRVVWSDPRAAAEDSAHARSCWRSIASASRIRLPIVDAEKVSKFSNSAGGRHRRHPQAGRHVSASQLQNVTIFGLGIMPYISASIIFQLLGSVYPPLEQLQKEGEAGRKKINEYTATPRCLFACSKAGCTLTSFIAAAGFVVGLVSGPRDRRADVELDDRRGADHDRRHRVPDVDRRADRRVRHRQRHQLADHGGHLGRHAGRRYATARAVVARAAAAAARWASSRC